MVPDLDDLEEMPEATATGAAQNDNGGLGGMSLGNGIGSGLGAGSSFSIPTLDVGPRGANKRFASRPSNNNDVNSVYRPGLH